MNSVLALDGYLKITFKKRTINTFLHQEKFEQAMDIDDIELDVEKTLARNLAFYLSRTEAIELCSDGLDSKAYRLAKDWHKFYQYAKDSLDKPNAVFMAWKESVPVEVDGMWATALNQYEASDPLANDPDLYDASAMDTDALEDGFLAQNDATPEANGEPV